MMTLFGMATILSTGGKISYAKIRKRDITDFGKMACGQKTRPGRAGDKGGPAENAGKTGMDWWSQEPH
jgi:hypothetical protein